MTKANYAIDQKVRFVKTSDSRLDGVTGSIVGTSSKHAEMDLYIVLLDSKLSYSDVKALAITEHCLEPVVPQM